MIKEDQFDEYVIVDIDGLVLENSLFPAKRLTDIGSYRKEKHARDIIIKENLIGHHIYKIISIQAVLVKDKKKDGLRPRKRKLRNNASR